MEEIGVDNHDDEDAPTGVFRKGDGIREVADACVGRPTREGDGVAATVLREEVNDVLRCMDAVWIWPSGIA